MACFCIFHTLSFELNFFFDRRCPLKPSGYLRFFLEFVAVFSKLLLSSKSRCFLTLFKLPNFSVLKTNVPLVSYIRNSLRFWYYASLSSCCQNLEKKLGSPGKFGRKRGQTFKGSDQEKCQF